MTDAEQMRQRAKSQGPQLFAFETLRPFGEGVAQQAGVALSALEERDFEDGEHKVRPLVSVRDRDVYVLQSLNSDAAQTVNDKLCKLLFFIGAVRDAGARSVTVLAPYLAYSRKDRKTKARDPVTTRYVAQLFEAVGTDRILTMDVHNLAAYQNAFRCRAEHLEARVLFADHIATLLDGVSPVVVSPDAGGYKRADAFRQTLSARLGEDVPMAFMEKQRSEGVIRGKHLAGPVEGRLALIFDDLISTGTTLMRAANSCREAGAREAWAVATHGLFYGNGGDALSAESISRIIITNTVGRLPGDRKAREKVSVLDAAPLVGEAVRRLHAGESVEELLVEWTQGVAADSLSKAADAMRPVRDN